MKTASFLNERARGYDADECNGGKPIPFEDSPGKTAAGNNGSGNDGSGNDGSGKGTAGNDGAVEGPASNDSATVLALTLELELDAEKPFSRSTLHLQHPASAFVSIKPLSSCLKAIFLHVLQYWNASSAGSRPLTGEL